VSKLTKFHFEWFAHERFKEYVADQKYIKMHSFWPFLILLKICKKADECQHFLKFSEKDACFGSILHIILIFYNFFGVI